MRVIITVLAGTVLLIGCSDPKKASEENFKTAINAYLAKNLSCFDVPRGSITPSGQGASLATFPIYVEIPKADAPLDALVSVGLLKADTGTIGAKTSLYGKTTTEVPVEIYDLTEAGKKAVVTPDQRPKTFLSSSRDQFCYGAPDVVEITQFTEPGPAMGVTSSQVFYTYRLKDRPDWANNAAMREAFPVLKTATADKTDGRATVVLTNDGWVDSRSLRR